MSPFLENIPRSINTTFYSEEYINSIFPLKLFNQGEGKNGNNQLNNSNNSNINNQGIIIYNNKIILSNNSNNHKWY